MRNKNLIAHVHILYFSSKNSCYLYDELKYRFKIEKLAHCFTFKVVRLAIIISLSRSLFPYTRPKQVSFIKF